jgi:hypothetical protein
LENSLTVRNFFLRQSEGHISTVIAGIGPITTEKTGSVVQPWELVPSVAMIFEIGNVASRWRSWFSRSLAELQLHHPERDSVAAFPALVFNQGDRLSGQFCGSRKSSDYVA